MPPEIQIQREINVERLRTRLRGMTDDQLLRFGKAARYRVSSYANGGKPQTDGRIEEAQIKSRDPALQWNEAAGGFWP